MVACDLHESLCDVARKAAAANGLSARVSVVHRDAGLLQRGREVRPLGVNLVIADMFDAGGSGVGQEHWAGQVVGWVGCVGQAGRQAGRQAGKERGSEGRARCAPDRAPHRPLSRTPVMPRSLPTTPPGLLGDGFPYLLELARRRVVQPGATVVPAGASLYCMGLEVATGTVAGFDMSCMDAYRRAGACPPPAAGPLGRSLIPAGGERAGSALPRAPAACVPLLSAQSPVHQPIVHAAGLLLRGSQPWPSGSRHSSNR